ncbi:MAG: cation-translocating P-type ATPase [Candidatus Paceibacterota bacterium]|jgi:heavy metal translocating P-type ATPase
MTTHEHIDQPWYRVVWSDLPLGFDVGLVVLLLLGLAAQLIPAWRHESLVTNALIALAGIGLAPVLWSAVRAIFLRTITIDLLASIALIFTFIDHQWVSAIFINLMLASARIFDRVTQLKTKHTIEHLMKLRPERVKVQREGTIVEEPVDAVRAGDVVVIEAGDRIPVDGTVLSGEASINQATITGESALIQKHAGDAVLTSTLNEFGSLLVRADHVGEDTTLAKIIALVSEASAHKGPIQRIADRFSAWYIVISLVGSALLYIVTHNASFVLSVLLVTCADDIAVAIPLGFTVAIAHGARRGVLIKGADIVERLARIKTFVTDKTGTLTRGDTHVVAIELFGGSNQLEVLAGGALCAINSHHPTSVAIVAYLKQQGASFLAPDSFQETPGEGIAATKDGHQWFSGKMEMLAAHGVVVSAQDAARINDIRVHGQSMTCVACDGKLIGGFIFQDELRPSAVAAIRDTKALGVRSWIMLTGDNEVIAGQIAHQASIDEFYANLKPDGKLALIKEIKKRSGVLAMIGDGVNDAASLALADVGFAMGGIGADATIEASDITLMHDDLRRIPESMELARATMRVARQNFWIWGITNVVGLGLVFGGVVGPMGAAAYNFITDFFPIANAFRLYRTHISETEK